MIGYAITSPLTRKYETGEFRHKETSSPMDYSRNNR